MIPMTLADVAAAVSGHLDGFGTGASAVDPVTDVVIDSRNARPGALFVALVGERVDGHEFGSAALAAGAVAVLAERPVGVASVLVANTVVGLGALAAEVRTRLLGRAKVVAITGSSGKTSTKDLLAAILESAGPTVAPRNSYNNDIGLPLTLLSAQPDTSFVVLEMGSRGPGHIGRLCDLARPDVGLVLNIGRAHVGEFGDLEATAAAKGELVEAAALAVLNADDPRVLGMASRACGRVVTYGRSTCADVRAVGVRMANARASFTLMAARSSAEVSLVVVGEHQVSNALGAAAVALELGVPLEQIANSLSLAKPRSSWRMEITERSDGVTVVNDAYNANPESMVAALQALAALARSDGTRDRRPRRTWAVLGQMAELGVQGDAAHAEVARLATDLAVSRLVVVGDEAARIHAEAVRYISRDVAAAADPASSAGQVPSRTEAIRVPDAESALALLLAEVRAGDIVLVKGSRVAGLERIASGLLRQLPGVRS